MPRLLALLLLCSLTPLPAVAAAKDNKKASAGADTLTFENGDTLHGALEREVSGAVYFKSDELGELSIPWSKIRSLHAPESYAVLENKPGVHLRHYVADAAVGDVDVDHGEIRVAPAQGTAGTDAQQAGLRAGVREPIAVKNAEYILDTQTFERQVRQEPNFFEGWNGSATAGATLVQGTQNQYTYASDIALTRTVPTVDWLPTRNRMQADFSSSFGEITQPEYVSGGVLVPATKTKSSIFHADAERDEYLANRVYGVLQTAFDHNYSQGLDLQQIYGAGIGVTAVKRKSQQLDLRATLQYEQQSFITGASGTSQDLVGSTLSSTYQATLKHGVIFHQETAYIPAFNIGRDYSANETTTLTIPFYKNIAFTLGTIDSYLNDPLPAEPPVTRNSFQFTTGVTYTIKSRY